MLNLPNGETLAPRISALFEANRHPAELWLSTVAAARRGGVLNVDFGSVCASRPGEASSEALNIINQPRLRNDGCNGGRSSEESMTETSMRTSDQNIVERVAAVVDAARELLEGTEHHGNDGGVTVERGDWNRLCDTMRELRQLVPIWKPIEGGAVVRELFDAGPPVDGIPCIRADVLPDRDEAHSIRVSNAAVESAVRYAVEYNTSFEHQHERNIAELGARRAIAHLMTEPVIEGEKHDTISIHSTALGEPTVWRPYNPDATPSLDAEFAPFSHVEAVIAANVPPGCPISRAVFFGVIGWTIGFGWLSAEESDPWHPDGLGNFVRKLAAISSNDDETP